MSSPRVQTIEFPLWRVASIVGLSISAILALRCSPSLPPDVLFITVDTLRADRVGVYGSTTAATPNIDRLAHEGAWFAHAVSSLPETRPSHFTLFTSSYPRDHGVVSNTQTLDEEALTLAEVYRQAGYKTAAFLGTILLDRGSGAEQGFTHLSAGKDPQRTAEVVLDEVEVYLSEDDGEAPLFLWVHLFDPHMPYEPQGGRPGVDAEWTRQLPTFTWPRLLELAARADGDLPGEAVTRGRELYSGEVEVVDGAVARLRTLLETRGRWETTLTVLTADHGECFEQGVYFEHSHCLGEGALAVPLIFSGPSIPTGRQDRVIEHLAVAPTLLRLSGLDVPESFAGENLFAPSAEDGPAFFQHPIYPEEQIENRRDVLRRFRSAGGDPTRELMGDRLQVGAREGRFKYLRVGDEEHLYDLVADPTEARDLSHEEDEVLRRLRRATREWLRDHPIRDGVSVEINPELREQLEALGYL